MNKKCTQIAIGGVFSALCLLLMFLTGMIPFASYALPAMAGAMLVAVVEENGRKTALLVYVSVAVLSLFVVPDRQAGMIFIVFFGYYAIIKEPLERLPSIALAYLCKLALFNLTVVGGFLFLIYVLGLPDILSDMGTFGQYTVLFLLGLGNLVFLIYDYALTKYIFLYKSWFKPTFLRR